ncbi:hypothetical protein WJX72_003862 [[Myrmecia] bisecta]|uniref:BTB domain-containing protein n=1 Tax=[Myrmecia] bisecta TaxID=41462 RepID=A0AAW1Q6G3_9CHLO
MGGIADEVLSMPATSVAEALPLLASLWKHGELCDVVLRCVDGLDVKAHRLILAAASPYWAALFAGAGRQMREGCCVRRGSSEGLPVLEVPGVDGDSLRCILRAVYGQQIEVTDNNVEGLLAASNYLEISCVQRACCRHLQRHLGPSSCWSTLAAAAHFGCEELCVHVMTYIRAHFEELMASSARLGLQVLPKAVLLELLHSEALETGSETEVFQAVLTWVAGDPACRSANLPELLAAVRLPAADLLRNVEACQLPSCSTSCDESLNKPRLRAAITTRPPKRLLPRQGMPSQLIAVGGHDSGWRTLKTVELYDPQKERWSAGPSMPTGYSFAGAAAVHAGLFVVNGDPRMGHVVTLDRAQRSWQAFAQPATPRIHSAVAALHGNVYVVGGRTGACEELRSVEYLAPCASCWQSAASMVRTRTSLAAGALGGHLYAVGGQDGRTVHASAEWYDPGVDRWTLLAAQLQSERKYTAVGVLEGRLYAVGGMTAARMRVSTVEAYDPREGRWQRLADMSLQRSSCGVAALQGCLYAVGGNDDAIYDTVEAYEPAAGRWRACAPIGQARSGLALAAV